MKRLLLIPCLIGLAGAPIAASARSARPARSVGFPGSPRVEGQPNETRPPEKADDAPAFPGQTRAPYHASAPFRTIVLSDKLDRPWSLALLPDGRFLVTEKAGTMRIVSAAGAPSPPLAGVPAVSAIGQVGLLDVVLAADFAHSRLIFFSFSEPRGGDTSAIAIGRARLDMTANALRDVTIIYHAMPALSASDHRNNQGGKIAIAPDGSLFVTIGDRSNSPPWLKAQELDGALGKIIHITPDGAPGVGNPFVGRPGVAPEIWSYGHRSEEGLAFDPAGRLWETEHGPRGGDELNLIASGRDYGWPVIVHGIDYPGDTIGAGITAKDGMEQPRYYWDPVIAPSGLAFYRGGLFPQWRGSIFVGALRGQMLDRLTLAGDKVVAEEPLLTELKARIRDVRVSDAGIVYVLTDDGRLLALKPR